MVAALLTAGNANESTDQNTHSGPDRTSDPKSALLSHVALILCLQLTLFSVPWAQTPERSTTTAPL